MMEAVKLTVRLPERIHRRLKHRAQEEDTSLNQIMVQAAELLLQTNEVSYPQVSEYDRAMRLLEEKGLLEPMGPEWNQYMSGRPLKTATEIRQALQGMPPLSDDIIAERGER